MWCCWIMIKFVEANAFRVDFILVVVIVVGPFKNSLSTTFDAAAGEDTILDSTDLKH